MTEPTTEPTTEPARPTDRLRRLLAVAALWSVVAVVALVVCLTGLRLRQRAWLATDDIRFVEDINNAFHQGTATLNTGYLDRYDLESESVDRRYDQMSLDYGPARLLVATVWARWVHGQVDGIPSDAATFPEWRTPFYTRARALRWQYDLCRPLLDVNLTGEGLSAVALFLLVRRFTSGGGAAGPVYSAGPRRARGAMLGTVAATFFWLNPALIWNAHCWPQWDSWVLPFFLWAVLCAASNAWLTAGLLVTVGATFKGQSLFAAPLFLLWPLFQGRPGAALRWVVGAAAGVAATTAVWLVRVPAHYARYEPIPGHINSHAVGWIVCMAVAIGLVVAAVRLRDYRRPFTGPTAEPGRPRPGVGAARVSRDELGSANPAPPNAAGSTPPHRAGDGPAPPATWYVRVPLLAVAAGLMLWPLMADWKWRGIGLAGLAVAALLAWLLPRRSLAPLAVGWVAAATLLCVPVFGGSTAWFDSGVAHGTTARQMLSGGENDNLPNLLAQQWGWELMDPAVTLPPGPTAARVAAVITKVDAKAELTPGGPVQLPLKYLLLSVWFIGTVLCAAGAAMHHRRGNVRFLVAVATPWLLLFAVTGQMHQRYLLWAACATAAAAAVSPGLAVTHVLLSAVAMSQEVRSMVPHHGSPDWVDTWFWHAVLGTQPSFGWAVVLLATVYLYLSVWPSRDRRSPGCTPGASPGQADPPISIRAGTPSAAVSA